MVELYDMGQFVAVVSIGKEKGLIEETDVFLHVI